MPPKRARSASPGPGADEPQHRAQAHDVNNAALDAPAEVDHDAPPSKRPRRNPTRSATTKKAEVTISPSPPPAPAPKKKKAATKKPRAKKSAPPPNSTNPASATHLTLTLPAAGPSRPSTSAQASASAPVPTKNKGKKKAAAAAPSGQLSHGTEKRAAKFIATLPDKIADRVARVRSQRIFMIDRNRVPGTLCEEFSVLGSTGNVYTVTIDRKPRCNCPDARFGNYCKHILFVFLKVLQVAEHSNLWYQKALLQTELQEIFDNAPLAPNSAAHPHIREAYARATGKAPPTTSQPEPTAESAPAPEPSKNRRIPGPEDDCPICYDAMHDVAEASLVFCDECGNAVHKECFAQWQKSSAAKGATLTCVWCRANWVVPGGAGKKGVGMGAGMGMGMGGHVAGTSRRYAGYAGYLNLSGIQ